MINFKQTEYRTKTKGGLEDCKSYNRFVAVEYIYASGNLLHKYFRANLQLQQHVLAYWSLSQIAHTPQVCFSFMDSNIEATVQPHWDHYDTFNTIYRIEDHISQRLKTSLLTPNGDHGKRSRLRLPWRRKWQQSKMGGVNKWIKWTDQAWVVEDGESKLRKRERVFNWMSVAYSLPQRPRLLTQLCVKLLNTWQTRSE